jgi:RND family efflux transporter MFP subunit
VIHHALHRLLTVVVVSTVVAGCRREAPAQHGFGPIPVETRKLAEQPVVESDDYLASLTSRRSITIYPQVTGYVQSIAAKPGDRVAEGALLINIDPGQQQATLRNLQANLASRKANLAYAVQSDESSRNLLRSGLLSQLDYDQRHSQRQAAEADLQAAQAQVHAQAELLRFYRITAPVAGIVGDVPVKVGDLVAPQTRLTSVDEGGRLEAYVYVPVDKVDAITDESTVALLDDHGNTLCEQKPWFVSTQVDVATQSILVKTACPNAGELRTSQVLTGRMIWARRPGLLVPTRAVNRLSGQYFIFVVEHGPQGMVARQRPIAVGAIEGNDYVVKNGLSPGDEVVISNVQKIRDGAPVAPTPAGPAGSARPSGGGPPG